MFQPRFEGRVQGRRKRFHSFGMRISQLLCKFPVPDHEIDSLRSKAHKCTETLKSSDITSKLRIQDQEFGSAHVAIIIVRRNFPLVAGLNEVSDSDGRNLRLSTYLTES